MAKTIRIPIRYQEALEANCLGSAGPKANITGMKKLYWGKDACVLACGQYIYHVNAKTYDSFLYEWRGY